MYGRYIHVIIVALIYISAGQSTDESSDSNDGINSNESSESDGM